MRLSDINLAIRPRSAWEALDLGILLARRQIGLLALSWALLTLPVFAALTLALWRYPTLSLLVFWWLKPLFERLPLYILSSSLFGDTPTLRRCAKALPGLLRPQWFASLTWRRFSLTRSFDLPVLQLEGLSGPARKRRLAVLGQRNSGTASWLTIVGMHLEGALSLGLLALLYLLIPAQMLADWNWQDLIGASQQWLWAEHLSNLLYALVLIVWEPIYVACGFSLYLNRRTVLEAWDIELSFRRLRERLQPVLPMLALGLSLFLVFGPAEQANAEAPPAPRDSVQPAPMPADPKDERLLNQSLTSQAASEQIHALLDKPPFRNRETVTRWRFGDDDTEQAPGWLQRLLESLLRSDNAGHSLDNLTRVVEVLLWCALFALIAFALWRYRSWITLHVGRLRRPSRTSRQAQPVQLFGLDLTPEQLPDDIAATVERLWADKPREALGLLYRALLSRLLHDRQLPLREAHTENEVLALTRQETPQLQAYVEAVTGHWLALAYGHRLPADDTTAALCQRWRELFERGAS